MDAALYNLIREHYRTLQGYVSAGMESGKSPDKIFMNANENPYELPGLEGYNRYPEPQPAALLDAYAALYGVSAENIVATRGADEAIWILIRLFCEPHKDAVLIAPPSFGMYEADALAIPTGVVKVPLLKEAGTFRLDSKNIIKVSSRWPSSLSRTGSSKDGEQSSPTYGSPPSKRANARRGDDKVNKNGMTGGIKLIFLCSPNNPTGTSFAREDILRICREAEGRAAVILDETYIEFAGAESLVPDLKNHPNLVILRTLSKSYAMAGMRLGCMLSGDADFIALIREKCLDAYPIPKASIEAALRVMVPENLKRAAQNREKLLAERDRLRTGFENSPLVRHIYPSDANFLFIEMEMAKGFVDFCAVQNIILRDFSSKPGTENCIRISPDLPENNDRLIALLREFEAGK